MVTLLVACVFMAGWVRSLMNVDYIHFKLGASYVTLASNQAGLWWNTISPRDPILTHDEQSLLKQVAHSPPHPGLHIDFIENPLQYLEYWGWECEWRLSFGGFHLAEYYKHNFWRGMGLKFLIVPYSYIVIPLTLISACLLLSKPGSSSPKKMIEPTANEGA